MQYSELGYVIIPLYHNSYNRYPNMKYTRIRELRENTELNQTEFAKILGMSQTGYSKYETGENDIPTSILIKIATYYDTSTDYILNLTDEKKPYSRKQHEY